MDADSTTADAVDDDVSGTTLDGREVTDLEVIDLVHADGSITIVRGPVQRLRRSQWAEQFGALARVRGIRASIRDTGRLVLILDVDWSGWTSPPRTIDTHRETFVPVGPPERAPWPPRRAGPTDLASPHGPVSDVQSTDDRR